MAPALILSTRNDHKLREFREALPGFEIEALPGDIDLPPEDGDTFAANALGKARAAHAGLGRAVIADDSGIEAAGLGGRPGVHSARYAGENATDEQNLAKLLDELDGVDDKRLAYVCAIAFVGEDGAEEIYEGRCTGTLSPDGPRGDSGFGYDPAFVPDDTGPGDGRTMAELSPDEKHAISHRGRAAAQLAAHLEGRGGA